MKMKRQQEVNSVSSLLNSTYGLPMLLTLAAIFTEAIFCLTYFYEHPTNPSRVLYLVCAILQAVPAQVVMQFCQTAETEVTFQAVVTITALCRGMMQILSYGYNKIPRAKKKPLLKNS